MTMHDDAWFDAEAVQVAVLSTTQIAAAGAGPLLMTDLQVSLAASTVYVLRACLICLIPGVAAAGASSVGLDYGGLTPAGIELLVTGPVVQAANNVNVNLPYAQSSAVRINTTAGQYFITAVNISGYQYVTFSGIIRTGATSVTLTATVTGAPTSAQNVVAGSWMEVMA